MSKWKIIGAIVLAMVAWSVIKGLWSLGVFLFFVGVAGWAFFKFKPIKKTTILKNMIKRKIR